MKKADESQSVRVLSRRQVAEGLLASLGGLGVLGALSAFGCGEGSSSSSEGTGGSSGSSGGSSGGSAGDTDAGATGEGSGSADAWASGGTAAMVDKASYPDPFAAGATTCALLFAVTEGPCTEAADQDRVDVSEGFAGLPMRLALRVVDRSCNPVANAKVKIWHTQRTGSYSGNTPNNGMCLKDQADSAKHYFRGAQVTDADGRVDFDSCFPGWYRGRAIHIHFSVTLGSQSFTSQLVFDQTLIDEIFASHPDYAEFGAPDTPNATDNVVGSGNLESFVLTVARMSDGAMLASKLLVVW